MSTDSPRPSPDPKSEKVVPRKANEVTELDLWDMDFEKEANPTPPDSAPGLLPVPRKSKSMIKSKKPSEVKSTPPDASEVTVIKTPNEKPAEPEARKEDGIPAEETRTGTEDDVFADFPDLEEAQPVDIVEQAGDDPAEAEESPQPKEPAEAAGPLPTSIVPALGSLTRIEKIAITALCAVLALGATLTLIHFYDRVPTRPLISEEVDLPVTGKYVEITAADTYWREPVAAGENPDVVRRGTKLIPVLKLGLRSNGGAIRVFFRNEEGTVVGDGITRAVKGDAVVSVAATAGFEDVGMHTAYRTGDGKRWVVQVFEAPNATAPREQLRKVLETEISTRTE